MKNIAIDNSTNLPILSAKSIKAANEAAAEQVDEFNVVTNSKILAEQYSVAELVEMYNACVAEEDTVKRFKNKVAAAEAAYEAMASFDFDAGEPAPKKAKRKKAGRKGSTSTLNESAIIKLHADKGFGTIQAESARGKILERLVEFVGRKKSVRYSDFRESLPEDMQKGLPGVLRVLCRRNYISVTIDTEEGEKPWVEVKASQREAHERRMKRREEKEAKKKANKKLAKAKDAKEDDGE